MDKTNTTIHVENLEIGYLQKKKKTAISSNINFKLSQGELTAVVGINGVGKSTLLRTLANLQPALLGAIHFHNSPVTTFSPNEFATMVSVVLTEPIAAKTLTVFELIALGRQPYTNWIGSLSEKDIIKVNEAINWVDLKALQHKKCYQLSDGQLQRVLIARALAQDTPIILLDEPTSHLDLYHKVTILKLLKNIAHNTNKTIVYTTHEIAFSIQLCDKIVVLDTDGNHAFGAPCSLIEENKFSTLFPKDTITFEPQTGTFKVTS